MLVLKPWVCSSLAAGTKSRPACRAVLTAVLHIVITRVLVIESSYSLVLAHTRYAGAVVLSTAATIVYTF